MRLADYDLFPRSIGQIFQTYKARELHLTFTQGRWNYEGWGYPIAPSAGTGVELWAWLWKNEKYVQQDVNVFLMECYWISEIFIDQIGVFQ